MPDYQVQFAFHTTSNLPEDFAQNNWSIQADDIPALEVAVATIKDFYDDIPGFFSNNVVQNGHTIKAYDRGDSPPRAPVLEDTYNLPVAPSGAPLPHQVAVVLSFQGARVSGVPQARRRGRIYIGPLTTGVIDTDARLSSSFSTALANAATALLTSSDAAAAWTWVIWSTVTGSPVNVTDGWVDNRLDTQRRRGRETTSRTTWS